jgi:hypothetical protein
MDVFKLLIVEYFSRICFSALCLTFSILPIVSPKFGYSSTFSAYLHYSSVPNNPAMPPVLIQKMR